jgi:hypothetical protein
MLWVAAEMARTRILLYGEIPKLTYYNHENLDL